MHGHARAADHLLPRGEADPGNRLTPVLGGPARTPRPDRDAALVQAIYQEHGRALLAYAARLTSDRGAAEDVVQEALIRAWRHPEVFTNGRGSTRGWLLTVVRNLVTDRYRATAARPQEVPENPDAPAVTRDHADSVVASVTVMAALDELSEDHRGVLEQIYFQGRTAIEAAAALGIPVGTVKSRSHYALRALRDKLAARELDQRPTRDERPAGADGIVAAEGGDDRSAASRRRLWPAAWSG